MDGSQPAEPIQGGACTLFQGSLSCPDEGDLVGVHHVVGPVLQHEAHAGDAVPRHQTLLAGVPEPLGTTAPGHQQEPAALHCQALHLCLILHTKITEQGKTASGVAFLTDSMAKPQKNAQRGRSSCLENKIPLRLWFVQDLAKIFKCCNIEK